jgi:hypothetical protein
MPRRRKEKTNTIDEMQQQCTRLIKDNISRKGTICLSSALTESNQQKKNVKNHNIVTDVSRITSQPFLMR